MVNGRARLADLQISEEQQHMIAKTAASLAKRFEVLQEQKTNDKVTRK